MDAYKAGQLCGRATAKVVIVFVQIITLPLRPFLSRSRTTGVRLTAEAAAEVIAVGKKEGLSQPSILRIDMPDYGGYSMNFEKEFDAGVDHCEDCYGVKVVCPKSKLNILSGTVIRFHNSPERRGFFFDNPNQIQN